MSCLGDCLDVGPPPDTIIFIPPPPVPDFLQSPLPDVVLNTTPCSVIPICEAWVHVQGGGKFSELPRKDIEAWPASTIDDTWLLILVASSVVVLLLGALLAMFLLKCREINFFGSSDCSLHTRDIHQTKSSDQRECSTFNGTVSHKYLHPAEAVLYTGSSNVHDNRLVWAALTPRGTQHFISESYPRKLTSYVENDVHYEAVDNLSIDPLHSPTYEDYQKDYDYEDPTPLIESYQMSNMETEKDVPYFAPFDNIDMSCGNYAATLRKGILATSPYRPQVSSPTRIEHPNLPPLNLYPPKGGTLKRNKGTYKSNHNDMLPKYAC